MKFSDLLSGKVAERLNALVLKTSVAEKSPRVQIPPFPNLKGFFMSLILHVISTCSIHN